MQLAGLAAGEAKILQNWVGVFAYIESIWLQLKYMCKMERAWTGNRTRVTRVAGEYSTTRPPMLHVCWSVS